MSYSQAEGVCSPVSPNVSITNSPEISPTYVHTSLCYQYTLKAQTLDCAFLIYRFATGTDLSIYFDEYRSKYTLQETQLNVDMVVGSGEASSQVWVHSISYGLARKNGRYVISNFPHTPFPPSPYVVPLC